MNYADSIITEFDYLHKSFTRNPELGAGGAAMAMELLISAGRHSAAGRISVGEFERIVDAWDRLSAWYEKDEAQDLRSDDL